jgi:hypothetical protein
MGIGDWGLGIGDWAQSPNPNPQLNKNIFFNIIIFNNYQNINIKKFFKFKFFYINNNLYNNRFIKFNF